MKITLPKLTVDQIFFVIFTLLLFDKGVCLPFNQGIELNLNQTSNREKRMNEQISRHLLKKKFNNKSLRSIIRLLNLLHKTDKKDKTIVCLYNEAFASHLLRIMKPSPPRLSQLSWLLYKFYALSNSEHQTECSLYLDNRVFILVSI